MGKVDRVKTERLRKGRRHRTMGGGVGGHRVWRRRAGGRARAGRQRSDERRRQFRHLDRQRRIGATQRSARRRGDGRRQPVQKGLEPYAAVVLGAGHGHVNRGVNPRIPPQQKLTFLNTNCYCERIASRWSICAPAAANNSAPTLIKR